MTAIARDPEEDLYADETCDADCRVVGRDGIHRCADAIANAHPEGVGPDLLAFYLGMSKQGAELRVNRALANIHPRARLARLGQ